MPFDKVETQSVDFPALERGVLKFWADRDIFNKRKALNAGGRPWSFLDGPITANNPMGVHHAWGRTYKDVFNRYFAMTGRELRYQQGFDCQGLWVEVEVEKELKLKSKRDIENLVPGDPEASVAAFVQACRDRVDRFARVQTEQSIRLGFWMNWDRTDADWAKSPDARQSYFTMSDTNNYTIWAFLKKCHDKGLIYRGYDVMPWCGRCGVGISEMEQKEGYKLIEHRAVFVKFPLHDKPGEHLLAWTTTPWTLSSNVAAAVNPKLTYLKVKLKNDVYYIGRGAYKLNRMAAGTDAGDGADAVGDAKRGTRDWLPGVPPLSSIEQMFKSKAGKDGVEVVGEVTGADMVGWAYDGPFDALDAANVPFGYPDEVAQIVSQRGWAAGVTATAAHRVIAWADVSETEGTGIVHIAPACGREDFGLGQSNKLPAVAPLDEAGTFAAGFGPLAGKNATDPATADAVFELLKQSDKLFAVERYVHRYPHCWRCKTELLYRLVDEWFIGMGPQHSEEGFRGDIMRVVNQVTFLPDSLNGRARERDWLWNMGDWMISKKRYWGLCLPVWVDEHEPTEFEVIGSYDELRDRAVGGWDEFAGRSPHRPYIDHVVIRNPRTGNLMRRVPDVGNPWLDAGIVAFSTLKYGTDPDYWAKWYPADFITESFPGQFRNWFYALLALSTMMSDGRPPFKTLLGFATVKDQTGRDMHKSDGNSVEFIAAADAGFTLTTRLKPAEAAKLPDGATAVAEVTLADGTRAAEATYPAIGADVMRWLYCRHNPANNLNFGPVPANEVRARFVLKLWNCYALLCNYARADGFDPAAPAVPVADRPAVDRWILSDLAGLVATANAGFTTYNVMGFALACEEFVDAKLSNWYIRVNRGRFWSTAAELDAAGAADKLAAYQTLYTTLRTLAQLIAPCVPFLAEVLWQNLRTDADPESVHLCAYPTANSNDIDAELSATMNAVLQIVTMGLAARNDADRKSVRQPLAELRVAPATDAQRRAVAEFGRLIRDELNVKAVTLHPPGPPLLQATATLNRKSAGAKLGAAGKAAEAELATLDPAAVEAQLRTGALTLAGVELTSGDITFTYTAPAGFTGGTDRGLQVALDGRVTPALKAEGLARTIVRHVQEARKDAGLDVSDRISLSLTADGELAVAIEAHRESIAAEVQAVAWSGGAFAKSVTVDGQALVIALGRA